MRPTSTTRRRGAELLLLLLLLARRGVRVGRRAAERLVGIHLLLGLAGDLGSSLLRVGGQARGGGVGVGGRGGEAAGGGRAGSAGRVLVERRRLV